MRRETGLTLQGVQVSNALPIQKLAISFFRTEWLIRMLYQKVRTGRFKIGDWLGWKASSQMITSEQGIFKEEVQPWYRSLEASREAALRRY